MPNMFHVETTNSAPQSTQTQPKSNTNSLQRTIYTTIPNNILINNRSSPSSNLVILNQSPIQQQQSRSRTQTLPNSTPTTTLESNINSDALPTVQERIEQFQSISRQLQHNTKPNSAQTTPQTTSHNKGQLLFNKLNNSINSNCNETISKESSPRIVRILTNITQDDSVNNKQQQQQTAFTVNNRNLTQQNSSNQSPQSLIKFNNIKGIFLLLLFVKLT